MFSGFPFASSRNSEIILSTSGFGASYICFNRSASDLIPLRTFLLIFIVLSFHSA
nr:MAG TPA: hypothetical protein [Caudoviricetes sp.]DAI34244.1 MAG TPA: hypothetical protein [Caudoviricetes sp.]